MLNYVKSTNFALFEENIKEEWENITEILKKKKKFSSGWKRVQKLFKSQQKIMRVRATVKVCHLETKKKKKNNREDNRERQEKEKNRTKY